jgi:hypothetical protein
MSLYGTPRFIVLNTTAASAADLIVSNRITYLQKNRVGVFLNFEAGVYSKQTAISSETAGVVTVTPTSPTNSTTYSFSFTQQFPNAQGSAPLSITKVISVTTPATGTITATTINDQFRNEYFALQSTFQVVATGTTTLILTANAGYPVIYGSWYNAGTSPGTGGVVNTISGIYKRGLAANLLALGVDSTLVTGAAYTLYALQNNEHTGYNNTAYVQQPERVYIWLNEAMTNYAALITRLDEWASSFASGGTTVDPEEIAIGG